MLAVAATVVAVVLSLQPGLRRWAGRTGAAAASAGSCSTLSGWSCRR